MISRFEICLDDDDDVVVVVVVVARSLITPSHCENRFLGLVNNFEKELFCSDYGTRS